jgi:hypothetical protein
MPRYNPPRPINTTTRSVSLTNQIFEFLEERRVTEGKDHLGAPIPRSDYIAQALVEKWRRAGIWPPREAPKAKAPGAKR